MRRPRASSRLTPGDRASRPGDDSDVSLTKSSAAGALARSRRSRSGTSVLAGRSLNAAPRVIGRASAARRCRPRAVPRRPGCLRAGRTRRARGRPGLAAVLSPPCTLNSSLVLSQVISAPLISSATCPARSRFTDALPSKRSVSVRPSYSMRSALPSSVSSTPSRFCLKLAGWPAVPVAIAERKPSLVSRTSTRSARICIVPCTMTTLPLKTTTWRCRSTVPGLSASITIGLLRSPFSARAPAGQPRHSDTNSETARRGRRRDMSGTKLAVHSMRSNRAPDGLPGTQMGANHARRQIMRAAVPVATHAGRRSPRAGPPTASCQPVLRKPCASFSATANARSLLPASEPDVRYWPCTPSAGTPSIL